MPVCELSPADVHDGTSSLFIRSDPAEAIRFVDGRWRSEKFLMMMISLTMPILYQLTFLLFADTVSKICISLNTLFICRLLLTTLFQLWMLYVFLIYRTAHSINQIIQRRIIDCFIIVVGTTALFEP
jgi:hypothetical protein